MVSENAVPIFNAPDRGAGPVERTGAAPDELRVEADRVWRKWYRIRAQSCVCRTRFDGSEMSPSGRRRVRPALESFAPARDAAVRGTRVSDWRHAALPSYSRSDTTPVPRS